MKLSSGFRRFLRDGWWDDKLPASLLSPTTFKAVVFGLRWGSLMGGTPYEFNVKQPGLQITPRSTRKWKIVTIAQFFNFAYFLGVLGLMLFGGILGVEGRSLFDLAFATIITILNSGLFILICHLGVRKRLNFLQFINTAFSYAINVRKKYVSQFGARWRNGCEELLVVLRICMIVIPVLSTLHYLQHPTKLIYVTSLIPRDSFLFVPIYVSYGLFWLFINLSGWATAMAGTFPFIGIIFALLCITQEVRPGRKLYRMKPSFRKPENLTLNLRQLQLLTIQVNVIVRDMVLATQTLIQYEGTICAFTTIRFWDKLTFSARGMLVLTAVCTIFIWTVILSMAVEAYTRTESALNSWRHYTSWSPFERRVMDRFRKSVRPVQLEVGGFYYLRPKKILSFWNTFLWLTVRTLLAFPDQNHHH